MQHAKHFQLYLVHFMAVDGAAVEFILLPNSKCKNRAHKKQHQQQVKDTDKVGEKGGIDRGAGIYALCCCCCCQDTQMRQATKTQQMRQTFHFWVCASAPPPLLPRCCCKAATSFDEQDASPKPEELKCGGTCVQVCVRQSFCGQCVHFESHKRSEASFLLLLLLLVAFTYGQTGNMQHFVAAK